MNITLGSRSFTLPEPGRLSELPSSTAHAANFPGMLGRAIDQVETAHEGAKTAANDLLIAGKGDVHSVALASQNAELSLELFLQVRNKFVQAYQEIMRMPM